jgi:hypothetical protein
MDQAQLNWITHFIWGSPAYVLMRPRAEANALFYHHISRTRLTADLVTGRLDGREAAVRLPEEAAFPSDLSDPSDESDLSKETPAEEES